MAAISGQAPLSNRHDTKKKQQAPGKARCLITAFNAFGSLKSNPSEQAINLLGGMDSAGKGRKTVMVDTLVLETCGDKAWRALRRKLVNNYDVLILTGAAPRNTISLERFALNIRDYSIKDNAGHVHNDKPIDRTGPLALRTGLDLSQLNKHLAGPEKGFSLKSPTTPGPLSATRFITERCVSSKSTATLPWFCLFTFPCWQGTLARGRGNITPQAVAPNL